ncbi:MAG: recombination mediator RecR [Bacteroidetes bacterium]|nr:recombination mediator RecR [Bacteroidota bacterium]
MDSSSRIVDDAVQALASFPGVGRRTALRMVIHLLRRPEGEVLQMAEALERLKKDLCICRECGNVSDQELCPICLNPARSRKELCVVEDFSDLMAIEATGQFRGIYHILGGLIAPVNGIGPDDLNIAPLLRRVQEGAFEEVILAFNATAEGDTTMFYLARKLRDSGARITNISRGINVGAELEYADEATLGRSILNRTEYAY